MSADPKTAERRLWTRWPIAVVALIALYVFSSGPAYWAAGYHYGGGFDRFHAVYRPLLWLCDRNEMADDALSWWWIFCESWLPVPC
ncbi:MAG TPA: hypothetical protein VFG04_21500 [Planctomycetaceae bacterium]|nr:hypothetical protein [Planctomycetaceae bacterium]